jgi:hypothetical protein
MEPKCILRVHNRCRHQIATVADYQDDNRRLLRDGRETGSGGSSVEASDLPTDLLRVTAASGKEESASLAGLDSPASFDCSWLVVLVAMARISMALEGFGSATATESVDGAKENETKSLQIH